MERLRNAGWQFVEWRDLPKPWTRRPFDRKSEIESLIEPILSLADLSARSQYVNDYLRTALSPARDFAVWIRRTQKIGGRNLDTLEARLGMLVRQLRRDKRKGRGFFAAISARAG